MPRPTFVCCYQEGVYPQGWHCPNEAAVLVAVAGTQIIHPACEQHLLPIVMERFNGDDRAKVVIRNARTWHVRKGAEA